MLELVHDQRSPEWVRARIGHLTASRMPAAMAFTKAGKETEERRKLKIDIVAERMTGLAQEYFVSAAMKWGVEQEPFARQEYEMRTGELVGDVGFVAHPEIEYLGASPDGLVGADGLVEIKCPTSNTHIAYLLERLVPDQYKPQMIVQMMCTGRRWCDFVSFDPRMPEQRQLMIVRYVPTTDEMAKCETVAREFLREVDQLFDLVTREETR